MENNYDILNENNSSKLKLRNNFLLKKNAESICLNKLISKTKSDLKNEFEENDLKLMRNCLYKFNVVYNRFNNE